MALRPWTPQDLPADFKLVWYHVPDSATVTLDANNKVAAVANKFTNKVNPATTRNEARRNSIRKSNGYDTVYGDGNQYGVLVNDMTGFPQGNADRFMMLVAVNDGGSVLWGYKHDNGGSNYWVDSDFTLKCNSNTGLNGGAVSRNVLHTYVANHKDGISTLRLNGVQRARGAVTITGATPANESIGIKGAQENFFTYTGGTLAAMYGSRAATADEMWLIEYWYSTYTGQPVAADNPYRDNPPMVDDGTVPVANLAANLVEASDAVTSAAAVRVAAIAALIEQDDTIASAGAARVIVSAAIQEGDDAMAATAAVRVVVNAQLVEADDQIEAMIGIVRMFDADLAEGDDTLVSTAYVGVTASAALIERDDTMASAGSVRATLSARLVETDDTLTSDASNRLGFYADLVEGDDTAAGVMRAIVTATADLVEGDDRLVSAIAGTVVFDGNMVEGDDFVSSRVRVRVRARMRVTEQNDTLRASWTIPVYAPPGRTVTITDSGDRSVTIADTGERTVSLADTGARIITV